jgi:hypothetical protein
MVFPSSKVTHHNTFSAKSWPLNPPADPAILTVKLSPYAFASYNPMRVLLALATTHSSGAVRKSLEASLRSSFLETVMNTHIQALNSLLRNLPPGITIIEPPTMPAYNVHACPPSYTLTVNNLTTAAYSDGFFRPHHIPPDLFNVLHTFFVVRFFDPNHYVWLIKILSLFFICKDTEQATFFIRMFEEMYLQSLYPYITARILHDPGPMATPTM